MKKVYFLILLAVIPTIIFSGCPPDPRVTKVTPLATIDPGRDGVPRAGYDDDFSGYRGQADNLIPKELNLITVHFAYDQYKLTPEVLDIMAENAEQLRNHPRSVILIEGHCDERGTEEYNLALGEKRAREVREYLLKYGIDSERISIISYGESLPSDYGRGEQAWAKNRRAEFAVLSK